MDLSSIDIYFQIISLKKKENDKHINKFKSKTVMTVKGNELSGRTGKSNNYFVEH